MLCLSHKINDPKAKKKENLKSAFSEETTDVSPLVALFLCGNVKSRSPRHPNLGFTEQLSLAR